MTSNKPEIYTPEMKELIHDRGSVYGDNNAWKILSQKVNELNPSKIIVLVDSNTHVHCLPYFQAKFAANTNLTMLQIPAGEAYKNLDTCMNLWNELSTLGADRGSLLINLGGGVVTDLGGFVASCFKRGIEFINVPTSLLAMVDASVGGKNGVDLGTLKNQIGIIRNPLMVLVDTAFLSTLPKNHFTSGMAEMFKHGLVSSKEYLNNIYTLDPSDNIRVTELIWESILIKNKIVSNDPFEKGIRKSLNYGHTLGHAIESHFLKIPEKRLLHGEAIAIGVILATYISSEKLNFPKPDLHEISQELLKLFPKVSFSERDIEEIIKLLIFDKKNLNGAIYFVLLANIGEVKMNFEVSNKLIYSAFEFYKNL